MGSQDLDVPAVTYEWLEGQPGGLHYALLRILEERLMEPTTVPGIACQPFDEPLPPDLHPSLRMSVYVMAAHISDLIHGLADRLGWDETKSLVRDRCPLDERAPIVPAWKQLIRAVHEVHQLHVAEPKLSPEELLRRLKPRV